jgi:hypothetical protein
MPFTSHATLSPAERQNAAVNGCVRPSGTFADEGEIEFVAAQVMVTAAVADDEGSAVLVAATLTVAGDGGSAGALYIAVVGLLAAIVPIVELPPAIPFTLQVTPVSPLLAPETLTVNTCSPPVGTLAATGEIITPILGGAEVVLWVPLVVPHEDSTSAPVHRISIQTSEARRVRESFNPQPFCIPGKSSQ